MYYCVAPFSPVRFLDFYRTVPFLGRDTSTHHVRSFSPALYPDFCYPFACYPDTLFSCSLTITYTPFAMTYVSLPPAAPVVFVSVWHWNEFPYWGFGVVGPPRFPLFPNDTMHHLLKNKNKRKKSPDPPQPGILTNLNIADRSPGFPTEIGNGSPGERSLSYRDR